MLNGIPDNEEREFEELECAVCFRIMDDDAQLARHVCVEREIEEDYQ